MKQVLNLARRSAGADITVLLRGEAVPEKKSYPGSSTSVLDAPEICRYQLRSYSRDAPESTVWPCQGAFTGAHQNAAGKFEQAEGGTFIG